MVSGCAIATRLLPYFCHGRSPKLSRSSQKVARIIPTIAGSFSTCRSSRRSLFSSFLHRLCSSTSMWPICTKSLANSKRSTPKMKSSRLASEWFSSKSSLTWESLCSFLVLIGSEWKPNCSQTKQRVKSTRALSHNGIWTMARTSAFSYSWVLSLSTQRTLEDGSSRRSLDWLTEKERWIWNRTPKMRTATSQTHRLGFRRTLSFCTLERDSKGRSLTQDWCRRCSSSSFTRAACLFCTWMVSYFTWWRSCVTSSCSSITIKSQGHCQGPYRCLLCSTSSMGFCSICLLRASCWQTRWGLWPGNLPVWIRFSTSRMRQARLKICLVMAVLKWLNKG